MSTGSTKLHTPPESQQMEDVHPRKKSFLFHTLTVAVMINGFLGLSRLPFGEVMAPQYGGFWQFLTIIGLVGSGIVMILAALSDLLPAVPVIRSIKRAFMLFAMPVEIVISSIYWPIVYFTPHLMLPPRPDIPTSEPSSSQPDMSLFFIPLWMDLSMHALPAVALLFDFQFLEKKYKPPASTSGATLLAATFSLCYSLWVEHCASVNGRFPYPFLTVMDLPGRVTLYAGSTVAALLVFRGLNWLHR